jgi:cytidine deaminase
MTDSELISIATKLVGEFRTSEDCVAGSVAAALVTTAGHVYTGICIDTACSLGFCAEHAAVAEMLKSRESEILCIVAVNSVGRVLPPCGRCRELLWQVNLQNANTRVILGPGTSATLSELLPHGWKKSGRSETTA